MEFISVGGLLATLAGIFTILLVAWERLQRRREHRRLESIGAEYQAYSKAGHF